MIRNTAGPAMPIVDPRTSGLDSSVCGMPLLFSIDDRVSCAAVDVLGGTLATLSSDSKSHHR